MLAPMTTILDELKLYAPRKFNRVTRQRFRRDRWRRLCAHVGGKPDAVQQVRINMIITLEWDLLRLSAKAEKGELSEHSARQMLANHNHLRMNLQALGPAAHRRAPTIADYLAAKHIAHEASA